MSGNVHALNQRDWQTYQNESPQVFWRSYGPDRVQMWCKGCNSKRVTPLGDSDVRWDWMLNHSDHGREQLALAYSFWGQVWP